MYLVVVVNVVMRYIGYLILFIPTPLVSAPSFSLFFMFFVLVLAIIIKLAGKHC